MSLFKYWDIDLSNTVRKHRDTKNTQGAGNSHYLFVGRSGNYDYDSFVKVKTPNWADVGKIIRATLIITSSDGQATAAVFPLKPSEKPKVTLKRLTDAFNEGTNPSTTFQDNDYSWAGSKTTSGMSVVYPEQGENEPNQFDVTKIVRAWADPKNVEGGGGQPNHGIGMYGTTSTNENIAFWSDEASDSELRPKIEIEYELGITAPGDPSLIEPIGSTASFSAFRGTFFDPRDTDTMSGFEVEVYGNEKHVTDIKTDNFVYTATKHGLSKNSEIYFTSLTGGGGLSTFTRYYVLGSGLTSTKFKISKTKGGAVIDITNNYTNGYLVTKAHEKIGTVTPAEIAAKEFTYYSTWQPAKSKTYKWRARVKDNENQWSAFSGLQSFIVTNTVPSPPTLDPNILNKHLDGLDGFFFAGTHNDTDGDAMESFQIQVSSYAQGSPLWDEGVLLWDMGRSAVPTGATTFSTPYGGGELDAGTYYWRARTYDVHEAEGEWAYGTFYMDVPYDPDPDNQAYVPIRAQLPWRILIKGMGANRGPGDVVGIIENAKSPGASVMYNSPGEIHFTLPVDHPSISVCEPRQTHYALEYYTNGNWVEKYAGLLMDMDATETDVVFYGTDYLGLYDFTYDEHYDPAEPDKPAEDGGSKYVTKGKNSIGYIIYDQVTRAKALANSPVAFITMGQSQATLKRLFPETLTVYSTFEPTLSFVAGLLDSHKQGGGKRSRISVRKSSGGDYQFWVQEDPGKTRDNLRLRYGEIVQGYRLVAFGTNWGSRMHAVGRDRNGYKVRYTTQTAPGIDEAIWGRFAKLQFIDGVSDGNDLIRRTQQLATSFGKLARQLGLGIRTGYLSPLDGYNICDFIPVAIDHGAINTDNFGSGYWTVFGVAWEGKDDGNQSVIITLMPKEDAEPPNTDLIDADPLNNTREWAIGWNPPNPLKVDSRYWLDQTTGIVYIRRNGSLVVSGIRGVV